VKQRSCSPEFLDMRLPARPGQKAFGCVLASPHGSRKHRPVASDLKPGLSADIEKARPRYPRTIDFVSSFPQNESHSERARIRPCSLQNRWMWNMSTDQKFATDRFPQAIRFVLVNNRVPRTGQHCALCGGLIEKGYVRDSQTRLIYCDTQCFAGWTHEAAPAKNRGRKAS